MQRKREGLENFQQVCTVQDIADGQSKAFSLAYEGKTIEIALFNMGGRFYAIANNCAHKGGPLSEGMRKGEIVTCPWHGWKYSVVTGKSAYEGGDSVDSYETRVLKDKVYVSSVPVLLGERKFKPHAKYVELNESTKSHLARVDVGDVSPELHVLGISTTNTTERVERKSTSEQALSFALGYAKEKLGGADCHGKAAGTGLQALSGLTVLQDGAEDEQRPEPGSCAQHLPCA